MNVDSSESDLTHVDLAAQNRHLARSAVRAIRMAGRGGNFLRVRSRAGQAMHRACCTACWPGACWRSGWPGDLDRSGQPMNGRPYLNWLETLARHDPGRPGRKAQPGAWTSSWAWAPWVGRSCSWLASRPGSAGSMRANPCRRGAGRGIALGRHAADARGRGAVHDRRVLCSRCSGPACPT